MDIMYHITKRENVADLMANGLGCIEKGFDGPGVYVWHGPLSVAVFNAISYILYNSEDDPNAINQLSIIAIRGRSSDEGSGDYIAKWDDYLVLRDPVSPEDMFHIGDHISVVFRDKIASLYSTPEFLEFCQGADITIHGSLYKMFKAQDFRWTFKDTATAEEVMSAVVRALDGIHFQDMDFYPINNIGAAYTLDILHEKNFKSTPLGKISVLITGGNGRVCKREIYPTFLEFGCTELLALRIMQAVKEELYRMRKEFSRKIIVDAIFRGR